MGSLVHAAMSALIVLVPEVWVALPAMFVAGMAWISVANSLTVAAQTRRCPTGCARAAWPSTRWR
jgi:hypothetical protein